MLWFEGCNGKGHADFGIEYSQWHQRAKGLIQAISYTLGCEQSTPANKEIINWPVE